MLHKILCKLTDAPTHSHRHTYTHIEREKYSHSGVSVCMCIPSMCTGSAGKLPALATVHTL